ncbi:YwqJ-related putative deaminase [Bacillus rhizoplanae]|uniref:YwqJ-related putative deaminase n=1 Tax=Bacillus rhizoplanae TaxID=2880966 RepID=UPI003D263669
MSLNMYLGEVRTQSQSMNAFCVATIQGMEQAINSIDAFVFDAVLQGQTYDSAKAFFAQTFRPLAQGIIYLCEELIRQNDAFPTDFQSKVASTDVIEHEILDQIREIERTKASIEGISSILPGMQVMVNIFDAMKRKLQEKLEHLHEFNYTSSSNYDTALQLAASIAQGLAEVQSGKGFNAASGTFTTQGLNMDWTVSIQKITEDKAREVEKLAYSDLIGEETINDETSSESGKEDFDGKKLARDIAGEISGEYDVRRAWEGVDPSTGEKLSTWDRFLAGGMAVAGLTPVGKIAKVGKGVKMTAKVVEGVKDAERAAEVSNSGENLSRIEYLRNKYGQFTSQELNYRINLRGAVAQEVERLNKLGISKREMGPAVAGTFDKTTGKYYFGINNTTGKIPEELHPLMEQRIINMPKNIKEGYTFTYGAGSHAEVYSLNQALLANPQASASNFITHVVRSGKKLKPAGMMMPTCPHCNFITEGFEFSSEVKKIGKSN